MLSLDVKKTELIIFHPKNTKLDYNVKLKLNSKRLKLISRVKYSGIALQQQLTYFDTSSPSKLSVSIPN